MSSGLRNILIMLMVMGALSARELRAEELAPGEPVKGLQATLAFQGSRVRQRDTVRLKLELRNVSGGPLSLYDAVSELIGMPAFIVFRVRKENGTPVHIAQPIDDHDLPSRDRYVTLASGTSLKQSFELGADQLGTPGRYEISLEVECSPEGRLAGVEDAWVGTILSNPVHVEVITGLDSIPPKGEGSF